MNNQRAHVIGLGISGLAAARLLLNKGWSVIASDSKQNEELLESIEMLSNAGAVVFTGSHEEALKYDVDLAVISPGIRLDTPVIRELVVKNVRVISELEIGWMFSKGMIAAITGSNGKTTTTALLGAIFKAAQEDAFTCGNIGLPLSAVAELTNEKSLISLEVSSFQLMTIDKFRPKIAVLLNLTPDHLDWHGNFSEYVKAKARVWLNQDSSDFLVYNYDDIEISRLVTRSNSGSFPFSSKVELEKGAFLQDGEMVFRLSANDELKIPRSNLKLLGRHNTENALAAISAALLMGVNYTDVKFGVRSFSPVPHRLESIDVINGVTWINDSKATNVEAGMAALEAMDKPVILIAGGRAKGGDFRKFRTADLKIIKKMILIGEAADQIERNLSDVVSIIRANDMSDAVIKAQELAVPGDTALLSPLCASFDSYNNFEERGDDFRNLVKNITGDRGNRNE
ncbi:UDP-N-acetylmuramoyl-L-alanine--D-glutamate ligase [bacterium]|nr:UDP-N-acetylmuramoyl-L-alanine--D-glutamate ligase [bacterium]